MSKLLIGNIDTDASEDGIRQFLLPIMSQVVSVDISIDPRTGKNRGYAYVILRTDVQAEKRCPRTHMANLPCSRNMTITVVEQEPVKGKWYKFGRRKRVQLNIRIHLAQALRIYACTASHTPDLKINEPGALESFTLWAK